MNVKQILLKHFAIYPKMQVIDAVKLLYQSEFGGGHMITNPEQSLNRLKQEWKQRQKSSEKTIVEEIGDGISRIDLAALDEGLAPETFNQMFINTAEHTVGTIENFEKKLAVLRELCTSGELPFHVEEFDCYLNEYKADVIVLAGFLSKLSESLCEEYKDRILNVHPALIPSFCGKGFYGLHVHEAALAYGVKVSGATVHLVDSEYDHGRIIMQKAVEVCEGDTPETLQQRIMVQAEHIILPQAVEKLCAELGE